jgi:protein-disulfide isomerase
LVITRRAVTTALSWTGVAALIGLSPFRLISDVLATSTTDNVTEPTLLPDMALGPADAAITMAEYASITCPHCAAFNENVFPKIKAAYIDTGKIRYVFHEFPLDPIAAASSVLSRCIADGDSAKFFAVTDMLFKQDWSKVTKPRETLNLIGNGEKIVGMTPFEEFDRRFKALLKI